MIKTQEKTVNLLQEISVVCQKKNMPFYLVSASGLQGFRSHGFESPKADIYIAMLYKDMINLARILKSTQKEHRKLESLYANPNLKSNCIRYIDTQSLYFPLKNPLHIKEYGIAVTIIPLFSKEIDSKRSLRKFLYLYWSENLGTKWRTKANSFFAKGARKICTVVCKNANATKRRNLLDKLYEFQQGATVEDTLYMYTLEKRKKITFPKGTFKDTISVFFEGVDCKIPSDYNIYFEKQYGIHWKDKKYSAKEVQKFLITDGELPYHEYFAYLDKFNISTDIKRELKEEQEATKELNKHNKVIKNAWNAVLRTDSRIRLWQKYSSEKDKIIELYNEKKWSELSIVLEEFDLENKALAKNKMSVSFDQKIWHIYLELLCHNGEEKFAQKIDKWLPEEYRTDFSL